MFEVIPAIDILNGKCVRLKQGQYNAETVYANSPLDMAKKWQDAGAKRIHIVDLDGARTGIPKNIDIIKQIILEIKLPIQIGGGIRSIELIKDLIQHGAERIILGTTAVKNPNLLGSICKQFPENIIVSIDAKDDKVTSDGWTHTSRKDIFTLAKEAIQFGIKRFVYTDISRDGMLTGPNIEGIKRFIEQVSVAVIASGGICSKQDIDNVSQTGAEAVIVGKALYEGKIKPEGLF